MFQHVLLKCPCVLLSLTLARWPVHIPDNVRMAARIISVFPVSMSCMSRATPLFWKILSEPASSRARTIRLLAAWSRPVIRSYNSIKQFQVDIINRSKHEGPRLMFSHLFFLIFICFITQQDVKHILHSGVCGKGGLQLWKKLCCHTIKKKKKILNTSFQKTPWPSLRNLSNIIRSFLYGLLGLLNAYRTIFLWCNMCLFQLMMFKMN